MSAPNPSVTPMTIDNDTPNPAPRKSPADFQAEAEAFNAKAAEIAKQITDEHARHTAAIVQLMDDQLGHALTRKGLIAKAGEYGVTPAWARSLLRKA